MSLSHHIRLLPIHVANKIAAGEVVERPSSVAKELIENAVDAGASQIDVEVVAGGRKLVAVRDNGFGMSRDDALLSIERQATSKIKDVDDIEKIQSLGFRGEALAAIASVSRFRLTSRNAENTAGTEILVNGGKIRDVSEIGIPIGTSMEVRDLFFNVPARRKFLRSYQTELSHIKSCFLLQALARPAIGMSLKIDGRETRRVTANCEMEDRIRELFGTDYAKDLRSVELQGPESLVSGYISLPAQSRSDRNEQFIFVNNRPTGAALINYAISEGYHTLMPVKRYPRVFLFITLDPGLVDVNVHPTKREVRFRHPSEVRDTVIAAIRKTLANDRGFAADKGIEAAVQLARTPIDGKQLEIENLPSAKMFRYPRTSTFSGVLSLANVAHGTSPEALEGVAAKEQGDEDRQHQESTSSPWTWCRVVGQVGSLYVVLETEDGYVMMDPHAAHERVLFERYMSDYSEQQIAVQKLLIPQTVEIGPKDAMLIRKNLDLFAEMEFGICEFGNDTFVVDALPACFSDTSAETLLLDIASGLERAGGRGGIGRWLEESIAQAACKAAVRARDKLSLAQIEKLVVDLAACEMPYTCPHGRPTLIFTSFEELNRKFGRQ